jgi:hypothetical protein
MRLQETRYSPEDVAGYLLKRLQSRKRVARKTGNGKAGRIPIEKKKKPIDKEGALSPYLIDQRLRDLEELIVEKSDLMKQIASDEHLLGMPRTSVTQDEVLGLLDGPKNIEDINIRALLRKIEPKQVFRTSLELAQRRLTETVSEIADLISDGVIAKAYQEKITKKVAVARLARSVESLSTIIEKAELAKMALLARRNDEICSYKGRFRGHREIRADSENSPGQNTYAHESR